MRIAMWSGPRNLSTAMMYSFAQRDDCAVWDEPFYAAYLNRTGIQHPMGDQVIATGENDPDEVIRKCLGPIPGNAQHFYQKHMTQHMIGGVDRAWIADVTNVFLIRHPARVISSYAAKRENPAFEDLGFGTQVELFDQVVALGRTPVVIDSFDIRKDPKTALTGLCSAIELEFDPAMLEWPSGGNSADGVWAKHWYGAVHRSTGFANPEGSLPELDGHGRAVLDQALPYYQKMADQKLVFG